METSGPLKEERLFFPVEELRRRSLPPSTVPFAKIFQPKGCEKRFFFPSFLCPGMRRRTFGGLLFPRRASKLSLYALGLWRVPNVSSSPSAPSTFNFAPLPRALLVF